MRLVSQAGGQKLIKSDYSFFLFVLEVLRWWGGGAVL